MHYIDKKVVTLIFRIEKVTPPPPLHFEVTRLNVKGSSSLDIIQTLVSLRSR